MHPPAVDDAACVDFLRWALPRLGLRWPGYRRVRGTVRKRLRRRLAALGLPDLPAYRRRLAADAAEWRWLASACRIPISRFCRDRRVYELLGARLLPALARQARQAGRREIWAWSAGCAGGEEPYGLALLWRLGRRQADADIGLNCLATDIDPALLDRARRGCYGAGSLKELPPAWREEAFRREGELYCLRDRFRTGVTFSEGDLRGLLPAGPFDLILCRNLAFTYFARDLQRSVLERLRRRLRPGGVLVLGAHERLPDPAVGFAQLANLPLYRLCAAGHERGAPPRADGAVQTAV